MKIKIVTISQDCLRLNGTKFYVNYQVQHHVPFVWLEGQQIISTKNLLLSNEFCTDALTLCGIFQD